MLVVDMRAQTAQSGESSGTSTVLTRQGAGGDASHRPDAAGVNQFNIGVLRLTTLRGDLRDNSTRELVVQN